MAFEDWTFGGLKDRVKFRLRNLPPFSEAKRGLAVNIAVQKLYLYARVATSIMQADTFVLQEGDDVGLYAMEYPLPQMTLQVQSVTLDGFQLEGPKSEYELEATGLEQASPPLVGSTRMFGVRTEYNGTKTLVLWPRPTKQQHIQVYGVIGPEYMTDDAQVPVFDEVTAAEALEAFACFYLTDGQQGFEMEADKWKARWDTHKKDAKFGMRLGRTFKTRNQRSL